MEELYANSILLSVGLISLDEYNFWLDDIFQNNDDDIYLQLEMCSNNINETIKQLNYYVYPYIDKLDYSLVGRIIFKAFENNYNKCSLEYLAAKAYSIWNMLPSSINDKNPFYILNYIDDPINCGDEQQTRELFQELFNYYN